MSCELIPEAIRTRAEAAGAPVVDRRNGHAQVGGEFADVEQGLQAPGIVCGAVFGAHVEQIGSTHPRRSAPTGTIVRLPESGRPREPPGGAKRWVCDDWIESHQRKSRGNP